MKMKNDLKIEKSAIHLAAILLIDPHKGGKEKVKNE